MVPIWSEKKALSFTDVFAAGRLSSPTMSPDGKWIVFAVKTPDIDRNTFQSDLYAADAEGMTLKKLTDSKGDNFNPRFLKSGLLTFISTRGDEPQIYTLNLKTPAEIKPITSIPGGVSNFIWLSDQKSIAFAKDIYPRAKSFCRGHGPGKRSGRIQGHGQTADRPAFPGVGFLARRQAQPCFPAPAWHVLNSPT